MVHVCDGRKRPANYTRVLPLICGFHSFKLERIDMSKVLEGSLFHWLHRASQIAERMFTAGQASAPEAITARQLVVIAAVASRDELSQTGVVDITGIDRSTLADLVRRLQKRGLLVRRRRKDDARAYSLKLSAEGRQVLENAIDSAGRVEQRISTLIGTRNHAELVRLLKLLVDQSAKQEVK